MKALLLALFITTPAFAAQEDYRENRPELIKEINESLDDLFASEKFGNTVGGREEVALKIRKNAMWCPTVKDSWTHKGIHYVYCDDGEWGVWYKVTTINPFIVIEADPPQLPSIGTN